MVWAQDPVVLAPVAQALVRLGSHVQGVFSFEDLCEAIANHSMDLVVAHLCGCFEEPLECLHLLKRMASAPPVLVAVDFWNVTLYMEAMRRGAFDGLALPLDEKELVRIAARALEIRSMPLSA